MFEGSLVESRGIAVSRAQRWSAVGSAAVQLTLAALVIIIPLMRPQTMKIFIQAPHLTMPPLAVRPPRVHMAPQTRWNQAQLCALYQSSKPLAYRSFLSIRDCRPTVNDLSLLGNSRWGILLCRRLVPLVDQASPLPVLPRAQPRCISQVASRPECCWRQSSLCIQ